MKEQKAYIGKDSIESLEDELKRINPRRILFFHGRRSYTQCGAKAAMNRIMAGLQGAEIFEYSDFKVNPEYEDLQKALELCIKFNPGLIVAVGGGSVMDFAKLVRFFYSYDGEIEFGIFSQKRNLVQLIAIPTTAGTGAEATHFAVVYKDRIKHSVEHKDVLPDISIVFSPFTYHNPPYLTACTGFDALAQGIEAFWNKNANDESDEYSMRAIELLYPNLPIAVNSPTEEVRDKIAEGSYWAGRAINLTKTTAPHAFSYPFTSIYGYPHGHAVALTFARIVEYNLAALPQKKRDWLKDTIPLMGNANISTAVGEYINKLGLNLRQDQYDLSLILSKINTNRLSNNPIAISNADAKEILMNVIGIHI